MSAMQGRGRRGSGVAAEAAFVLLAILFAAAMFVVGIVVGRATKDTHGSGTAAAATSAATTEASTTQATSTQATTEQQTTTQQTTTSGGSSGGGASLAAGKQVFTSNCSSCHTLKDAGALGNIGPNLDQLKPQRAVVKNQVIHGGGAMPAFKGTLSDKQINAVAQYVSSVAGK